VVEPLLVGIVLGLIPVTLAGLFVAAYMQYKRGDQLGINK
jgi:cytochrome b6-f complex subunit 5